MEWTTIDYEGATIMAADFLGGVIVSFDEGELIFIPGYYVQPQEGDMDGPALRPRKAQPSAYGVELREIER